MAPGIVSYLLLVAEVLLTAVPRVRVTVVVLSEPYRYTTGFTSLTHVVAMHFKTCTRVWKAGHGNIFRANVTLLESDTFNVQV